MYVCMYVCMYAYTSKVRMGYYRLTHVLKALVEDSSGSYRLIQLIKYQ